MRKRLTQIALFALTTLVVLGLVLAATWAALPDVAQLSNHNPRTTALIDQRRAEARKAGRSFRPRQTWVAMNRISPRLIDAVVLSEDARFYAHGAFDWQEMRNAAQKNLEEHRFARGASTLTQQLAKNLFLGTEKTLTRKAKEAILAMKLDRTLSKRRILALYLNVAEWGEGVFGIEAAARAHFSTSAAGLSSAQSCALAAMLPMPRRVSPAHPSRRLRNHARIILDRMLQSGRIDASEHARASAELERMLVLPGELAKDGPDEDEPDDD